MLLSLLRARVLPLTPAERPQPNMFPRSLNFFTCKRENNSSVFLCTSGMDSRIIIRESGNSNGNRVHNIKNNDMKIKLNWVQCKRKLGSEAKWKVHACSTQSMLNSI